MDYSQKFLKQYLHKERPLRVTNEEHKGSRQVRISISEHDGRAVITTNWAIVVKDAQILRKEMVIFWFKEDGHGLCVNVFAGIPVERCMCRCCYGFV